MTCSRCSRDLTAVYPVTDAPGLGIEVNEALLHTESFKFWEAPHLKRRDGSVTNW